jgi:hypothetical protein
VADGIKCEPHADEKSKTESCTRSRCRIAEPIPSRHRVAANNRSPRVGFSVVFPQNHRVPRFLHKAKLDGLLVWLQNQHGVGVG